MARCGNPGEDVWVLDDETAGVIGQTVIQRQGPPFGWTDAERAEPALYLSGSITDPAARTLRPGTLMAWWTVDLAVRQGAVWVRRHAQVPQIAACDQAQGFYLVREEQRTHTRLYMLARKAERLDLSPWFGADFRQGTPVPPGRVLSPLPAWTTVLAEGSTPIAESAPVADGTGGTRCQAQNGQF